jgi:hypothetical protein
LGLLLVKPPDFRFNLFSTTSSGPSVEHATLADRFGCGEWPADLHFCGRCSPQFGRGVE